MGGVSATPGALASARQELEDHLQLAVEPIDVTRFAALTDRITAGAELTGSLAPLVGVLLRTQAEAAA